MELRHLRYFVAVAEELNLTHAAQRLRVAQPALSRQIKDLEEELQASLFQRGRAGVQLTRAGKVFYQKARSLLSQTAEAIDEARAATGLMSGSLCLGFPSGLHLNRLAPVLERFHKMHPKVEFDYFHGTQLEQVKALRQERVDIAFLNLEMTYKDLEYYRVWRQPFKVVLPKRHPLAGRKSFELSDLRGEDFVFCTRESRPGFYDEFLRQCANVGFRPRVVKEIGGYPTNILGLISVGVGLSVLPYFAQAERLRGLIWRPLVKPELWWDWALAWPSSRSSRVVDEFIALARTFFPQTTGTKQADF